jgi:hypothetical protein
MPKGVGYTTEEMRWKVEGAASTLIEAEKIRAEMKTDKKFKKGVQAQLMSQQDAINKATKKA